MLSKGILSKILIKKIIKSFNQKFYYLSKLEKIMPEMEFPCIKSGQHGRTFYTCVIPSDKLSELYCKGIIGVDVWKPDHPKGYQRLPAIQRAKKFGLYVKGGGISPTSLLMYQRDLSNGVSFTDNKLIVPIKDVTEPLLYLVDGQHRALGLKEGYLGGTFDDSLKFDVPVVILLKGNIDPYVEEAQQFVTINSTQKRVRTDLASQQLLKIAESGGGILKGAITPGSVIDVGATKEVLKLYATYVANALTDDPNSPLHGKIVRPAAARAESGLPSSSQFEDSLLDNYVEGSVMTFAANRAYSLGEIVELLKNYWGAIFELLPSALESPSEYHVTKTLGTHALNALLPSMFNLKRLKKVPSKDDFKKILSSLELIADEDLWGKGGVIGEYGGGKGAFKRLTKDLHTNLLHT
jgi:DGQHR domain-containing protein